MTKQDIINNFRTERYALLNKQRWETFLSMDIPIRGKIIFEPGAGIGDQTEWLLKRGAEHIYVSDGRQDNLEIIKERFGDHCRLTYLHGDIETCLDQPEFQFHVELVFCWGVYYHVKESFPGFHIMRGLARIGEVVALDYLEGNDEDYFYGYENNSTSVSQYAFRPRTETLMKHMKQIWGHAYHPEEQLKWVDPVATESRLIAVGSYAPLKGNLVEF